MLQIVQACGVLLGIWAVWVMSNSKISVFPQVQKGATLIKKGPYSIIRHPMYTALLLFFLPDIAANPTLIRIVVFILFVINMIVKILFEEKQLRNVFPDYKVYQQKSKRVIPYIW